MCNSTSESTTNYGDIKIKFQAEKDVHSLELSAVKNVKKLNILLHKTRENN